MRIQCIARPRLTWTLPTIGMLFSAWQATTQALQPMQTFMSTAMPHCWTAFIVRMHVKCRQHRRKFVVTGNLFSELVIRAVSIERCLAHQAAAFDAPVFLRDRERIFPRGFLDLDALDVLSVRDNKVRIVGGPQQVGVEANLIGRLRIVFDRRTRIGQAIEAGHLAGVTERDGDRIVDVTRNNESRDHDLVQPAVCRLRLVWTPHFAAVATRLL